MNDHDADRADRQRQTAEPTPETVSDTAGLSRGLSSPPPDTSADDTTVMEAVYPRAYSEQEPPTLSFQAVNDPGANTGYAPRVEPEPVPPTHDEFGPIREDNTGSSDGGMNVPNGVVIAAVCVTALIVLASVISIVMSGSDSDAPDGTGPVQAQENAQDPQLESDRSPGIDNPSPGPQPSSDLLRDGQFTWYGDRVSQLAARHAPIIATPDETYYFNANDGVTVDRVLDSVDSRVSSGEIGDMVIFAYGTTEQVTPQQVKHLIESIGPRRGLILVGPGTTNPQSAPWVEQVNEMYRSVAEAAPYPHVQHVDWGRTLASRPDLVSNDYVLTETGTQVWADQINEAIANYYDD